jgi:2-keto-4-pentenoate hydratase
MSARAERFDLALAAAILADAWKSGSLLSELPRDVRPRTMSQGYDIQDVFVAQLGDATVGWKLGVGSAVQKRQSGAGRSIAGRLLTSRVYCNDDIVPLPNAAPVTVEFEVAYVLGLDVQPDEKAVAGLDVVSEVRAAFELVLSRFVDRRAVGWPSFAADDAAFQALVVGSPLDYSRISELVVELDGQEAARSVFGEDATDPEAALCDLISLARERKMVLPRGSIISTGTVSKPFNIASPAAFVWARFLETELGFQTQVHGRTGE